MMILGIDPGLSGAIAVVNRQALYFHDMPTLKVGSRYRLDLAACREILIKWRPTHVYLESVHTHPQEGAVGAFSFGRQLGSWEGMLAALQIPYTMITPQSWKAKMLPGLPKEKGASIQRLLQLYPELSGELDRKRHHNRADAALIALYGTQK